MAYSANIRIRTDYRVDGRPSSCRRDGTSALYLQIIIEGKVRQMPLELAWPPSHFDRESGRLLPRHADDNQCQDYNLICQQALGDANEVFTEFRLRRQPVTLDGFLREYRSPLSKVSLLDYFNTKLSQRRRDGLICELSYQSQFGSLKTLRQFAGGRDLLFVALAARQFPEKFEAWLRSQGLNAMTRWNKHKTVRTYIRLALRDNIYFIDPYLDYKVHKPKKGNWRPLFRRDLQLLDAYYQTLEVGSAKREVLQRWLFGLASCGLRISDQARIDQDWRIHNLMVFVPWKSRKTGRRVAIELSQRAQELWDDAMRERPPGRRTVFTAMSGQKSNKYLHEIQEELGLTIRLHNHVARHTFATLFLEAGGQLHILKEYLGHANINSTMIYVETTPDSLRLAAHQVDGLFGERMEKPSSLDTSSAPPPRRFIMKR